jgi:hypothetical protein
MLLLGGDLSSQCLSETHDTRRLRIRRSQMLGEKGHGGVIAKIPVTRPVYSPELHKDQLLGPIKHPTRYRTRRGEVLQELISSRGRRGHAFRFTADGEVVSTGAPHVSNFFADGHLGRYHIF